jgi:hypothetical protein
MMNNNQIVTPKYFDINLHMVQTDNEGVVYHPTIGITHDDVNEEPFTFHLDTTIWEEDPEVAIWLAFNAATHLTDEYLEEIFVVNIEDNEVIEEFSMTQVLERFMEIPEGMDQLLNAVPISNKVH